MPIRFIRIVICPGTTVPMGTKQDPVCELRLITCDNIRTLKHRAVVALQKRLLRNDAHAILLELADNPLLTVIMRLAVHRASTKIALSLTERIGTIGTESRAHRLHGDAVIACLLSKVTTRGEKE